MIEPDQDTRVIDQDAEAYNATLVAREDIGPDLGYFRVKLDGPAVPFEPGQYMTIGVIADGKLLQRPYSVASAPTVSDTDGYEFFVRHVPVVRFTTALWRLPVGQRMRMIGPKGRFMLEPVDERTHLYVSTGTGIAPFIAMVRETMAQGRPRRTVVLNGVSYADELGYRSELEAWQQDPAYRLTYVPTISRPDRPAQRRLDRQGGPRRAGGHRHVQGPGAHGRHDRGLHLRQPRDDPQRGAGPDRARLPGAPREEGALLAEGEGAGNRLIAQAGSTATSP